MEEKKQFKKNFIWNIVGTGFNAFNSLFLMIIVTRINGTENAGIYTLAFSTASILYIIGIYAGRIYQVTENDNSINDKDYILNRMISCSMILVFVLGFVILKRYDGYKSLIFILLALYRSLDAFAEVFYGVLQKQDLLDKVGKSIFFKSIMSLCLFGIIDCCTKNLIISLMSIVFIYIAMLFLYDIKIAKKLINKNDKARLKKSISIFKGGFYTFALSFLGLYMANAQKYAIDKYLENNIQAIFGIIIMPATIMGLLSQFLIHPYITKIFEFYKNDKYNEIKQLLYKIFKIIIIFGLICSCAGYLLGTPILGWIYKLDLASYSISLTVILIGATCYTIAGIISPILITMRYTKIQFFIYVFLSIFEYIISDILIHKFEFNGAIIAYFITMLSYFIVFYSVAMRIIHKKANKVKNKNIKV